MSFLQAECDMAARRGDFTQAIALTREIDKLAKTSTLGPLLRVRLFTMLGKPDEVAHAYGEAIERERGARQLDYRVLLGQVRLKIGEPTRRSARPGWCWPSTRSGSTRSLLQARALAESGATPSEKAARRKEAIARLQRAHQGEPHPPGRLSGPGRHPPEAAGERASAIAVLKDDLRANPERRRRRRPARAVADGTPAGRPGTGRRPTSPRPVASPPRSPAATPRGR